ncbi:hypothetical protein RM533_04250 [Croceicoccus sp. F390]|uniref:TPM domain-containing protein n=1 Tax=Croceicoccus esteveae TaxID=3075597 RepID=A0ABU2ZFL4_9SPHN|nr:hypothetical protein [Croceicoccus sp. F390]MDT0575392.1 hypothetical protein [Croceicoccus sp. F390]
MNALLGDEDHAAVSAAVAEAEARTSGEIVTVLAERSDSYHDIALAWAALAGMSLLVLASIFPAPLIELMSAADAGWGAQPGAGAILAAGAMIAIAGFLICWFAQTMDKVRFALVPGGVRTARVHARALTIFKVGAERRTKGHTGIIIYLSLRERRAEILADQAIAGRVSEDVWGEAMAAMLFELKQGRTAPAMIVAVRQVGLVLAEHFPRETDDRNELPDRLIEL